MAPTWRLRKTVVMTRNVLNMWEVDKFLHPILEMCASDELRLWLERTARRWIVKNLEPGGHVTRLHHDTTGRTTRHYADVCWADGTITTHRTSLPDWVKASLETGVHWLDMTAEGARNLRNDLQTLCDHFLRPDPFIEIRRLHRISLLQAINFVKQSDASTKQIEVDNDALMTFPDGFRVMVLDSEQEFAREGRVMRHCAASYWQEREADTEIVSLRSPSGKPCVY